MATLIYNDGSSTKTITIDLSAGIEVNSIGAEEEWELTTIDDSPLTTVAPFIGGRPDDR